MTTKNSPLDTAIQRIVQPSLSTIVVVGGVTLFSVAAPSLTAPAPAKGVVAKGAVAKEAIAQGAVAKGAVEAAKPTAKAIAKPSSDAKPAAGKADLSGKTDNEVAALLALKRARQLKVQGADSLAERQLVNALQWMPGWAPAQRELAGLYSDQGRWIEAAAAWRKLLAAIPVSRRANSDARRQFERARAQLSAFWKTRDVVELGADSENFSSLADVTVAAPSTEAPTLAEGPTLAEALETPTSGLTTLQSLAKAQPRLGGPYRANATETEKAIALLPSIPSPQPPLQAASVAASSRKSSAKVGNQTAHQRQLAIAGKAGAAGGVNAAILAPAGVKAKQAERKALLVATPAKTAGQPQTAAERLAAAHLALARGRQLAAQNVETLAEAQFQRAADLLPDSLEVQMTLARWHSKQAKTYQQWGKAMQSWRHVLFMQRKAGMTPAATMKKTAAAKAAATKKGGAGPVETRMAALAAEANREFLRARRHQSALWNAHLATTARGITDLGEDSNNLLSSVSLQTLRSLAKVTPRTGAKPVTAGNASVQKGLDATKHGTKPTTSFVFSMTLPASEESAAARSASIGYTRETPQYKKVEEVETVDNPKLVDNSEK